jgi:peptidoglycan hydrolase-like protein with peptidoglycan-binding domain
MPRPRPATEAKAPDAPAARTDVPASASAPRPPVSVGAQRSDPLADLIVANRRIASAQRALTEFGFGQIKPTGVAGPETKIAVERFERERRLPVTGQLSDRVMREISAVTGRSFD